MKIFIQYYCGKWKKLFCSNQIGQSERYKWFDVSEIMWWNITKSSRVSFVKSDEAESEAEADVYWDILCECRRSIINIVCTTTKYTLRTSL